MADISLELIKQLREDTGAGVMDCKRALEKADGDLQKAAKILAEEGIASAAKKSHRVTAQGLIDSYIHAGRIGAIVEVNCETDFVARTPEFQNLAREIAMQVVASSPMVVAEAELQEGMTGAPEETVLLLQPYIRDPSRTIQQLVNEVIAKTGENIQIARFSRFEIGQGS
jgi:elongation factor Ts